MFGMHILDRVIMNNCFINDTNNVKLKFLEPKKGRVERIQTINPAGTCIFLAQNTYHNFVVKAINKC